MLSQKAKEQFRKDPAKFIENEVKAFVRTSKLNRMPLPDDGVLYEEPMVHFAEGDDPLFTEYKTIIHPAHLTPREALAKALNKSPEEMPSRLSVISWILPITRKTRESNRRQTKGPSRRWAYTRWYGEKFNDALRRHVLEILQEMGYLAVAPMLESYFKAPIIQTGFTYEGYEQGFYSNYSERHVAYAAGLGTFSLSDGFITERGIAHRCGSIVTDLALPPSPRTAENHYSNCLFYADGSCNTCITRCPAGAITESGHDKIRCRDYLHITLKPLLDKYSIGVNGCGLCQTKVPCESRNPVKKLSKKAG